MLLVYTDGTVIIFDYGLCLVVCALDVDFDLICGVGCGTFEMLILLFQLW